MTSCCASLKIGSHDCAHFRIVADLDSVESTGIAALSRAHNDDDRLNELLARIATEILYPLPAPSCTTLSRDYFYINQHLGFMFVPLAEGHFLLHLPDIYHELAYPHRVSNMIP